MPFLNKEQEYGNIEYKLHLNNISDDKIIKYSTQMNFRLNEGNGLVFYIIGIKDNGCITGLNKINIEESINNLKKIANSLYPLEIKYEIFQINKKKYFSIVKLINKNHKKILIF